VDIRLPNTSHLNGFTKFPDVQFFLREVSGIDFRRELALAPTDELFEELKGGRISLKQFETRFIPLLKQRNVGVTLDWHPARHVALLCNEEDPSRCHRTIVADYLASTWNTEFRGDL
jgi:hypothetical protein